MLLSACRRSTCLLGLLVAALGVEAHAAPAPRPAYTDLGLLISSQTYRYGYAYAPTIIREGGRYHMAFCSYGRRGIWDHVRYAVSDDGRSWSDPVVIVEGSDEVGERAACDPSLVRYKAPGDPQPFWYLFYSGNAFDVQTAMFVARSERIEGPYAKWTRRGTWEVNPPDPAIIIGPANPKPEKSAFYGAGQQTVLVENGRLVSWYSDDTGCPTSCMRIFRTATRDPTDWPRGTPTDIPDAQSTDVKRDPGGGYVMVDVRFPHSPNSVLVRRRSRDGLHWTPPETLCGAGCFPPFAHNSGIAGDSSGALAPGPLLVVYGAPPKRDGSCGVCHAKWDLFGGLVAPPQR